MTDLPSDFAGLRVAAFESRKAAEMHRLIEKFGGIPYVSPSMRETPREEDAALVDFAHRLITGEISIVIFLTGVGFRQLTTAIERNVDGRRFLAALSDITTVARGPKPVAAMKEVGLTPTYRVPEPNTWRELLATLDQHVPIANQVVALQEYGQTNPSLMAGLEARGAEVLPLRVYNWELPEDTGPLEANLQRIAAGDADVLLFTSAQQIRNVFQMADRMNLLNELTKGWEQAVTASIGPTTSETLREFRIPVDLVPPHPKMGQLVSAAAKNSNSLLRGKRAISRTLAVVRESESTAALNATGPHGASNSPPWFDGPFMKACRREPCDTTPVWLMRQAGRYMPEYRRVREKTTFLELCKNPALCSEVMCTAVARLGVDAAIIFSDLLPILEPMGLELEFAQGEGPVIHNPVRDSSDVDRVLELESVDSLHFAIETVKQTRADLSDAIPVIGFAGAPFTLASYAIEGGASRSYLHVKTLMYRDEVAWRSLMERLSRAISRYLNAQIAAGAQCVQIFDSWAGCLGVDDYTQYVAPYLRWIIAELPPGVPVINFATGNPGLLPLLAESGAAVIGVDWRVPLTDAWETIGYDKAIQGNLDPAVLLADPHEIRRRTQQILQQAGRRPGHIFNLGHGVHPQTPVENAVALVEAVHEGLS